VPTKSMPITNVDGWKDEDAVKEKDGDIEATMLIEHLQALFVRSTDLERECEVRKVKTDVQLLLT
jgi:hypothetical protein